MIDLPSQCRDLPGAIKSTRHGRSRIGVALSGTSRRIHPGELNEDEHHCRSVAWKSDNRFRKRSVRMPRSRQGETRAVGTLSRSIPRFLRLPRSCAKFAQAKLLLMVFIVVSPTDLLTSCLPRIFVTSCRPLAGATYKASSVPPVTPSTVACPRPPTQRNASSRKALFVSGMYRQSDRMRRPRPLNISR